MGISDVARNRCAWLSYFLKERKIVENIYDKSNNSLLRSRVLLPVSICLAMSAAHQKGFQRPLEHKAEECSLLSLLEPSPKYKPPNIR